MFERFTERARQVVVMAQDESRSLWHNYIGTEHLLLGLLRVDEGLASRVLTSLDVSLEDVRGEVVRIVGRGDEEVTSGQIPFTPRAKKVLELALREALSLGHNYVGTEHILLGVVREGEGIAARILNDLGIDAQNARDQVIHLLALPRAGQEGDSQHGVRSGGGAIDVPVRWEYRVEVLPHSEPESRQAYLNSLGVRGWQLVTILPVDDALHAYLQRRIPPVRPSPPRPLVSWKVGALGPQWSNPATRNAPLTMNYLTDCLARAKAIAEEASDAVRRDALGTLEQQLNDLLATSAATFAGNEILPLRPMKIDSILQAVVATKEDLIVRQEFEQAATTRDIERRFQIALNEAVELMSRADTAQE